MFGALKALSNSEKAVAIGFLVLAATVMVFTGHLTIEQWKDYTEFMAVTYVGGKVVQGSVDSITKRGTPANAPTPLAVDPPA